MKTSNNWNNMPELHYRKAEIADLESVMSLFKEAVLEMERSGIYQWDHIYPSSEVIESDIMKEQLYVSELADGMASVFVLNQEYDQEYNDGDWSYNGNRYKIIHRLCTSQRFQNQGIGTATMVHIEDMLRQEGMESIRLDAYTLNPVAMALYGKLGYRIVGHADWRKGRFYLMEKNIKGEIL